MKFLGGSSIYVMNRLVVIIYYVRVSYRKQTCSPIWADQSVLQNLQFAMVVPCRFVFVASHQCSLTQTKRVKTKYKKQLQERA